MSLQQFLAVGRSFAESPREKSPFFMRKNVRLPVFENAPRFAPKTTYAVQTNFLEPRGPVPASDPAFGPAARPAQIMKRGRRRSWLEILTFGLFGQPKANRPMVQEEMQLENVRVIRNDLADSDLEVVVNKEKKFALRKVKQASDALPPAEVKPEPLKRAEQPRRREQWSHLTAKLFEIGRS